MDTDRTVVYLGNRAAIELVEDPAPARKGAAATMVRRKVDGAPKKNCTTVVLAPGTTLMEAAVQITDPGQGVWRSHSDDAKPAWVASTNPALAGLLAEHYGCELREPAPAAASGTEG